MSEITKQDLGNMQDTILQVVNKGFQGVQDQFEKVDERFESIESRLDGIDARFDGVDEKLNQHSEALDTLTKGIAELQAEAGAQNMINDRMDKRIARLERHVGLEPIAA